MEVPASGLFQEYESNIMCLTRDVANRLDTASRTTSDAPSEYEFSELERRLVQADRVIKQMDYEVRSMPQDSRKALDLKVKGYRAEISKRREGLADARHAATRRALLNDSSGKSLQDRERLINSSKTLDEATLRLEEANRVAMETVQIGAEVTLDLKQQHDVINRAHAHMHKIGESMGTAKGLLDSLGRRAMANKWASYAVMIFMSMMLLLLAFFAVGGHSRK